jgi:hypothetical protein
MSNEASAELAEPGVGEFDYPASFVTPEFPAVLVAPKRTDLAARDDEALTVVFPSRLIRKLARQNRCRPVGTGLASCLGIHRAGTFYANGLSSAVGP